MIVEIKNSLPEIYDSGIKITNQSGRNIALWAKKVRVINTGVFIKPLGFNLPETLLMVRPHNLDSNVHIIDNFANISSEGEIIITIVSLSYPSRQILMGGDIAIGYFVNITHPKLRLIAE